MSKQDESFPPLSEVNQYLTVEGADTDKPIQPDHNFQSVDSMEDMAEAMRQLRLGREDNDKQKAKIGLRENKPCKQRVRTSDRVWCCECKKYRRGKSNTCRKCGHSFHECDTCEDQHRRDKDEDGPSCITMGPVEGAF
jgi:uncharacterized ferredoxin-like protein